MGVKARKVLQKKLKKASSSHLSAEKDADFLPLEGKFGNKLILKKEQKPLVQKEQKNTSSLSYVGRIPHGFLKWKTRKLKHYGFIQFEDPEVAEVVADCMHNYLLFEHLLQVHLIPTEHVHPKLWRGFNYRYKTVDWVQIERKQLNKERTCQEHKKLVEKIMKQTQKRPKKIEAAGLDYDCPEIVGGIQPAPKEIKFDKD